MVKNLNIEVYKFIEELNHPFKIEINKLRSIILSTDLNLTENIKWNGPNYCYDGQDIITMRVLPPAKQVQLIFHRGAKKMEQPKQKFNYDKSVILFWKENYRAVDTFKSMSDIANNKDEIVSIFKKWLDATSEK